MTRRIDSFFIKSLKTGRLINFDSYITGVSIDSRKIKKGTLFIALQGSRCDGHLFIKDALSRGAALCAVSKKWADKNKSKIDKLPLWVTDSPEESVQTLAAAWRRKFSIPVLAITGTNGKTTTRSMMESILKTKFQLHSTSGNQNTLLGVPLTLLKLRDNHNFCILEMGTNHFGEIKRLCNWSRPTAGLITNIGNGHLAYFNDLKGVSREKEDLFLSLPENGTEFVNADDPFIIEMSTKASRVTYGFNSDKVDVKGKIFSYDNRGCPTLEINGKWIIKFQVPGKSTALNGLPSVAVGLHYGIPEYIITNTLENFTAMEQRFNILNSGPFRIIDDTYNANPDSTIAALQTLTEMEVKGRRLFVLGDMLELGKESGKAHSLIGEAAAALGLDLFFAWGPLSEAAIKKARSEGMKRASHFTQKKELISTLKKEIRSSDIVLIKGSRGSRMEEIIKGIMN